jgi:hypothetical protein
MDEFDVVLRARRFLQQLPMDTTPIRLEAYLTAASDVLGAKIVLRRENLPAGAAGHTVELGGKHFIEINAADLIERQRFTVGHELAHLILGLPTEHGDSTSSDGFVRRSLNEILCDVFAAEILLPFSLLKARVEDTDLDFAAIDSIAADFQTSRTATGSRVAVVCDRPCAFVLAEAGRIRYASLSTSLRDRRGWIRRGVPLPESSLAAHLRRGSQLEGPIEVSTADWLDDWKRGGVLLEDARLLRRWDQTLSLIWFEDDSISATLAEDGDQDEEELGLRPLDGVLSWPGKPRRRR